MSTKKENKGPSYSKRVGMIRGSVWENETEGRKYFNTSIVRRYRDGEEWKDVSTLNGTSDIVAAIEVLSRCKDYINEQEDASSVDSDE